MKVHNTMEVLVVLFKIKPQFIEAFAGAIRENARLSLANEPGCRQFDVCINPAQPAEFFLYELYDSEQAIQAHLESGHFLHMNTLTTDWVDSKQVWRYRLPR
jgi:(4S)-4-hydroxy-5-phosphonooxypentane-2,3-dione isomerase